MNVQEWLRMAIRRAYFKLFAGCILCALSIFSLLSLFTLFSQWIATLPSGDVLQVAMLAVTLFFSLGLFIALVRTRANNAAQGLTPSPSPIVEPWRFLLARVAIPLSMGIVEGYMGLDAGAQKTTEKKQLSRFFSAKIFGSASSQRTTLPVIRSGSNENFWDSIPLKMR